MSPYLLRDVPVTGRTRSGAPRLRTCGLPHGCVYLPVLDWCSRDVLAWELSVTVDGQVSLDALETRVSPEDFDAACQPRRQGVP